MHTLGAENCSTAPPPQPLPTMLHFFPHKENITRQEEKAKYFSEPYFPTTRSKGEKRGILSFLFRILPTAHEPHFDGISFPARIAGFLSANFSNALHPFNLFLFFPRDPVVAGCTYAVHVSISGRVLVKQPNARRCESFTP